MKKILLSLCLLSIAGFAKSQGLENIIVEKYYISDANDATMNSTGGVLPVGSVTYRIFVDMLPGYRFQAAYGLPTHELRIETTTLFFNNEDRGATTPTYSKTQARNNTVMLDSWLSVGAACTGNFGVLKADDNGVSTNVNNDGILTNTVTAIGIPLTVEDGLIAGSPKTVTMVGISTEAGVFDAQNDGSNGPLFSTTNGSWASLTGSIGPDSLDNKVLIAQITTDGVLTFKLNIQIGTPSNGVENYVAENATGAEVLFPGLTYSSLLSNVAESNTLNSTFSVYPTPATDIINMKILNPSKSVDNSYTIYGIGGNAIMTKKLGVISVKHTEMIDISSLANGLYFIQLVSDGIISTKRIVKN